MMAETIWEDTHRAFVSCFHAFYPSGYLKWACVCSMLAAVETSTSTSSSCGGQLSQLSNHDRLLTAVLDALCNPLIRLRNTFPITYSPSEGGAGGGEGLSGSAAAQGKGTCKGNLQTGSALSPTENLASITASMIQARNCSQTLKGSQKCHV